MKPIYKPQFCKVIIALNVIHVHYVILSHLSFIIHFIDPFTSHACAK